MTALLERGHDVTLVVTTGGGDLEPMLDPRVHFVALRPGMFGQEFLNAAGFFNKLVTLPDLLRYTYCRAVGMVRMTRFLFFQFDAAAILLHGTSTWFVKNVVNARAKFHFIRNDLSRIRTIGKVVKSIGNSVSAFDNYICVSETVRKSLTETIPATERKAIVIHNILNPEQMRKQSGADPCPLPQRQGSALQVVSVCRLQEASKGLVRMARVCKQLSDRGIDFRWYVIGDGPDRGLLQKEIELLGIENIMQLLGPVANPFPAYAAADVVAVLSYYEGLCGVVNEAKVTGSAVVATEFAGVREQLVDGVNGLIAANNQDSIAAVMECVLTDHELRSRITNDYLPPILLNDAAKLDKFEALLSERLA